MSSCDCGEFEALSFIYPIFTITTGFLLERLLTDNFGPNSENSPVLYCCWAIGYSLCLIVYLGMFLRMFTSGSMRRQLQGLRSAVTQTGVGVAMLQMDEKRLRSVCSNLRRHVRDIADHNRRYHLLNLLNMAFLWDKDHSGVLSYEEFETMTDYAIRHFDIEPENFKKLILPLKKNAMARKNTTDEEGKSQKSKRKSSAAKDSSPTNAEWLKKLEPCFHGGDSMSGQTAHGISCPNSVQYDDVHIDCLSLAPHSTFDKRFSEHTIIPPELLVSKAETRPCIKILENKEGLLWCYGENDSVLFTHDRCPLQEHVVSVKYEIPKPENAEKVEKTGLHFDEFLARMKNSRPNRPQVYVAEH